MTARWWWITRLPFPVEVRGCIATLECVEIAVDAQAFGRALKADGALVVSAATAQQFEAGSTSNRSTTNQSDRPDETRTGCSMKNRLNGTVNL